MGSSSVVTKYKSNVPIKMHSGLDDKKLVLCRLTAAAKKDQETEGIGVKSRLRSKNNFKLKCRRKPSINKQRKDRRKHSIMCTEKR